MWTVNKCVAWGLEENVSGLWLTFIWKRVHPVVRCDNVSLLYIYEEKWFWSWSECYCKWSMIASFPLPQADKTNIMKVENNITKQNCTYFETMGEKKDELMMFVFVLATLSPCLPAVQITRTKSPNEGSKTHLLLLHRASLIHSALCSWAEQNK